MPTHINPPGVSTPTGYSHVVSSDRHRTIYLSGQIAVNAAGEVVGEGNLAAQTEQVWQNIATCLAAAGASFADIVKMTTYVVSYKPDDRLIVAAARAKYLPADRPPASTLVGVQALARPEFLIEIEAIAMLED